MSATKVITGKVRFSFANVFEPKAGEDGGKEKYSLCIIIPKSDKATIKKIKAAVAAAAEAGAGKFKGGKIPKNFKQPLRDGDVDREDDENFADSFFLNASSLHKPQVVDKALNEIMNKEDFYSGAFGRISINFYVFNTGTNQGVAAGLENVQKTSDGPRLGGGGATAEQDFGDLEDFEDDEDDLY